MANDDESLAGGIEFVDVAGPCSIRADALESGKRSCKILPNRVSQIIKI